MPRATLLVLALLFAGCAAPDAAPAADVSGTFYPLAFAAQRLGGDNLTTATIVPADIEPHDWEPSAQEVARLSSTRLVLAQGAGFEPWLGALTTNLGEKAPRVVETTEGMRLAQEDEGPDPHTWLAPRLFAQQVGAARDAMTTLWPEHAADIDARAAALVDELDALHESYASGLADCDTRVIIANHDAYGYLGREYEFDIVALSGLSPEAEPTPDAIARAIDVAREHNITIIFFEELVSPRVAEVVADEVGAQTRVLSPIEGEPEEGDVLTLMQENLVALREAMRCT